MQSSRRHHALQRQLQGYRLATAEIVYRMPDYPDLLQTFIWQHYDLAPGFPELRRFLDFWAQNLDGALHSVRVMRAGIVQPCEFRTVGCSYTLH